jgi:hypothetical protein
MLLAVSPSLCPTCAELRTDDAGSTCPVCGGVLVSVQEPHLEGLVQARLRKRIEQWRQQGLLSPGMASRLIASLGEPPAASPAKPLPGSSSALEQWADELAASIQRVAAWRPG